MTRIEALEFARGVLEYQFAPGNRIPMLAQATLDLGEENERLRAALKEALDGWEDAASSCYPSNPTRIAELRKLGVANPST